MVLVVKIGGANSIGTENAIKDISEIESERDVIVVHGGSSEVDKVLEKMGLEPEYVESVSGVKSRFTDEETMEVFSMVLAGKLNIDFTSAMINEGIRAVGLSGVDGELVTGKRKSALKVVENGKKKIKRGDHSGKVEKINTELLEMLMKEDYTPVVTVPMLGDGTPVNADADRVASAIAGEMNGELILLTDVEGVKEDAGEGDLIQSVNSKEDWNRIEDAAEGFMKKKVMAVKEGMDKGIKRAIIFDANNSSPVSKALEGLGTVFHKIGDKID